MATNERRAAARRAGRAAAARRTRRQAGRRRADGAPGPTLPSVANHPRAGTQVAQAKAWGGLVGFGLVAALSWRAGVLFEELALRALAGGIVAYLVVWACAVAVWRHLVMAELRIAREQREQEEAERRAMAAAAAASDGDQQAS